VSPAILSQLAVLEEILRRGTWRPYRVRVSASDRFAETYALRAGTIDEARDVWAAATGLAPAEIEDASTPVRRRRRTPSKTALDVPSPEAAAAALVDDTLAPSGTVPPVDAVIAETVAASPASATIAPDLDKALADRAEADLRQCGKILPPLCDACGGVDDPLGDAIMPQQNRTQNAITLPMLRDACGVSRIKLDRELKTPDARSFIAVQLANGVALDVAKAGVLTRLVGAERLQAALASLKTSLSPPPPLSSPPSLSL
jgi:hypothetical protein